MLDQQPTCSKGWARPCAASRGRRCRCAGHNHGRERARENGSPSEDRNLFSDPDAPRSGSGPADHLAPLYGVDVAGRLTPYAPTLLPGDAHVREVPR